MPTTTEARADPSTGLRALARLVPDHRVRAALGIGAFVGALLCVRLLGDRPPTWYPHCIFHGFTGLQCPGCGTARALHALAGGKLLAALDQNALTVALLPLLVWWAAPSAWRGIRHNLPPIPLPTGTARIALIVMLAFTLLRNLPWWPFTVLAPQ